MEEYSPLGVTKNDSELSQSAFTVQATQVDEFHTHSD